MSKVAILSGNDMVTNNMSDIMMLLQRMYSGRRRFFDLKVLTRRRASPAGAVTNTKHRIDTAAMVELSERSMMPVEWFTGVTVTFTAILTETLQILKPF